MNNYHCDNCNKNFNQINNEIYNDEINLLNNILIKNNIPEYFNNIINSYIYNDYYKIISETKIRKTLINMEDFSDSDSDNDIYEPYIYKTLEHKLCEKCFITGIEFCLDIRGKLPFLRNDIYYFLNNNINRINKYYKKNKFILPSIYSCSYYRNQDLEEINNKIKIKSY